MDEEICSTCLSQHRNLTPLSTVKGISYRLKAILALDSTSPLCWECKAVLQRMQKFINQAHTSKNLLKQHVENDKSPKTLQSLSNLTISMKTIYDENIVYGVKSESLGGEGIDDFHSRIKYNREDEVIILKVEKCEQDYHEETFNLPEIVEVEAEFPSESEPCYVSAEDSDDEKPLITRVTKKTVKRKTGRCKKKTIPKKVKVEFKSEIGDYRNKTSKDEEKFNIKKLTRKELYRLRDEDRKNYRYLSCPYRCEPCITGYYSEEKYTYHMKSRHSEEIGPHSCDICQRRFKVFPALIHHRDVHLRRYQCRECDFSSHRLSTMLIHHPKHNPQKFTCKECGLSFPKPRQLRYHRETKHKERPTCGECGKKFAYQSALRKHTLEAHGGEPLKTETCNQCGGEFRDLRAHLITHEPPPADAFCVECGKGFKNWMTYRRHIRLHRRHREKEDVLKFECSECPLRFSCKTALERHAASRHTKQYPFSCDVCSKGFTRRDRLQFHVLEKHEGGERPRKQVCNFCNRAFKTRTVLIHHIRTHTGEKPHQCQECSRRFAQRTTLKTHIRLVHGKTSGAGNTGGGGKTDKQDQSLKLE